MAGHVALPWIHRVFSLIKRWGLGTYHGLRDKHLDAYLNEFAFRYNRRFYRHVSFETMLGIASRRGPAPYRTIVGCVRARTPPNSASDHKISINLSQRDKPPTLPKRSTSISSLLQIFFVLPRR